MEEVDGVKKLDSVACPSCGGETGACRAECEMVAYQQGFLAAGGCPDCGQIPCDGSSHFCGVDYHDDDDDGWDEDWCEECDSYSCGCRSFAP